MTRTLDRRQFLKLAGYGGVVFASALAGCAAGARARRGASAEESADFFFVQLSDTHIGFSDPKINPDYEGTLQKAVASVNALPQQPDFVMFTGDLSHTTDDPIERRRRLTRFRDLASALRAKQLRYMPGEHDASLDRGAAFREFFGDTHYSFDHKGVHFIVLDNVSDPAALLGEEQLAWLAADLAKQDHEQPIVAFTHRPLFDLAPSWDWATRDGGKAIELLKPYEFVTVFYGHIHQEHHHQTGHIAHHAAKGLMFPLPAPLSVPKKAPIPWDAAAPYKGLGFREAENRYPAPQLAEFPVQA
jgi:hypothetical protein